MELFTVVGTRSTVSYTFPSSRIFNQIRDDVEVVLTGRDVVGTRSMCPIYFLQGRRAAALLAECHHGQRSALSLPLVCQRHNPGVMWGKINPAIFRGFKMLYFF